MQKGISNIFYGPPEYLILFSLISRRVNGETVFAGGAVRQFLFQFFTSDANRKR